MRKLRDSRCKVIRTLLNKFTGFLEKLFQPTPTLDELEANFPHGQNCSQKGSLVHSTKEVSEFSGTDPWIGGTFVRVQKKYLECTECKIKVQYFD